MQKTLLLFSLAAGSLFAQAQNNFTAAVTRSFNGVRGNLEQAADAMPAEKYSFKLTPDQMSFGEWVAHAATASYGECSMIKGEQRPAAAANINGSMDKAALSAALKAAMQYCADSLQGMDDAKALANPMVTNNMLAVAVHNNECYGNMVGYLRISGVVPPSTANRMKGGKGGGKKQ